MDFSGDVGAVRWITDAGTVGIRGRIITRSAFVTVFASVGRSADGAVVTSEVVSTMADAAEFTVTFNRVGIVIAISSICTLFSTAGVVGSAFSAEATVSCFVVESRVAERAVVAFPGVAALALAASASVARHIHSVAIAVFFIRAVGGAGRIATEVGGAGGAVGVGIVSFRAHRAVGASPGVHALAGAVGVKTRNTHGVGGAVRDVLALPAAVGVDTVVAISDVAGGAVVGGRGREVGGAEFASRSVPLIGAVAGAVGNQS